TQFFQFGKSVNLHGAQKYLKKDYAMRMMVTPAVVDPITPPLLSVKVPVEVLTSVIIWPAEISTIAVPDMVVSVFAVVTAPLKRSPPPGLENEYSKPVLLVEEAPLTYAVMRYMPALAKVIVALSGPRVMLPTTSNDELKVIALPDVTACNVVVE